MSPARSFLFSLLAFLLLPISSPSAMAAIPGAGPAGPLAGVPDGSGGMFAAMAIWHDGYSDLYLQHVNASGVTLWSTAGTALCRTLDQAGTPVLVPDGAGGAIVTWQDARGAVALYAQRVNASGTPQWTPGGVAISTTAHAQVLPQIMSDGAGGAIVTWRDIRTDPSADIWAQRLNAAGAPQWGAGGVAICAVTGGQNAPVLVADGAGGAFLCWTDSRSGNSDIYAQRVNGAGVAQWTADGVAVVVMPGLQSYKKIVTDGAGGAIIAWQDQRNGAGAADIYAQRLNSAGAAQWTANGVVMCAATGDQLWPAPVPDGAGGAIVLWQDRRNGTDLDLYAQRVNSAGTPQWASNGVAVCVAPGDALEQVVAADGAGGMLAAWTDSRGTRKQTFAQRASGAGASQWTANGVAVGQGGSGFFAHSEPALAADGTGGAIVSWYEQHAGDLEMYAQRLGGTGAPQWAAAGVGLFVDPGVQRLAATIPDGAGGALVTWAEKVGADYHIYARRLDAAGSWTWPRTLVSAATGFYTIPALVSDGAGGAVIAWIGGVTTADVYAQRLSASGVVQWAAGGVAVCAAAGDQYPAGIVSDGAGGTLVAWSDARGGGFDIYAQRLNASGAPQWTANGVALCAATGDQTVSDSRLSFVTADGAGGAVVIWGDGRSGSGLDIYAQRVSAAGAPQWTANGVPVCVAAGDQHTPVLVSDGLGGVVAAWEDYRNGRWDIYAQRLNGSGAAMWVADGVAAETSVYSAYGPAIAADGAGGAIVSWSDYWPPSYDGNIHAQRLWSGNGTSLWTADGAALCTAPGHQYNQRMSPDGSGGVVVTWEDHRSGPGSDHIDIYAQRVDGLGIAQWVADGVAVCLAADSQLDPVITTDGAGGAILFWEDRRDGVKDYLYAQRVSSSGLAQWLANGVTAVPAAFPAPASGLTLERPWPNPSRGGLAIAFVLPDSRPAALEILDVSGRRVLSRPLDGFGAGRHELALGAVVTLKPGIYLVRLEQGGRGVAQKVCVLR